MNVEVIWSFQKIFNLNQRDWKLKEPIQIKPSEYKAIRNFIIGDNLKAPFKEILKHGEKEQELQFDRIQQQFISSVFEKAEIEKDNLRKSRKKKRYDTIPQTYIAGHDYNRWYSSK